MKDELGLYYHPIPNDKALRVYVRESADDIEFRMWRKDAQEIWDRHGWVPYTALQQAAEMYKERGSEADPMEIYDISIAKVLLKGVH